MKTIAISYRAYSTIHRQYHLSKTSYLNYQKIDYSKDDVISIIGPPLIKENSKNLWIYRADKKTGIAAFKQTVYNKTLKLKFEDNILRSFEEIDLN